MPRAPSRIQTLELQFEKGLQTQTDPKLQLQGELLDLVNGVFDKVGRINKRTGFDLLSNTSNSGSVNRGQALTTIPTGTGSDELCLYDGYHLYSYSDASAEWVSKGKVRSPICTNFGIVQNNDQQTSPDLAYVAGVECHVRADSRGGIYYSIVDSETRTIIVPDRRLAANGSLPKVFALGNTFVALYASELNQIRYHTVSALNPTGGFGTYTAFCSDLHGTQPTFDGVVTGTRLFIAYNSNAASVKVNYLDTSLALGTPHNQASIVASDTIATFTDSSQRIWVVTADGTAVKTFVLSYALASILGNTTLETIPNIYRVTGVVSSAGVATVYYELNASATYNQAIRSVTCSAAGVVTVPAYFKRSVGLAAKAFALDADVYIPVAHQSALQSTVFVLDGDGDIAVKLLPGTAGGLAQQKLLPNTCVKATGKYLIPTTVRSRVKSDAGVFYSLLGIGVSQLDFTSHNSFLNTYIGRTLLTVGGVTSSYDGAGVTEHNFHLYPENYTPAQSNTSSGAIVNGEYRYKCVYLWYDNSGNPHRSNVGPAVTITTTGANDTVTITCPTLRLTAKQRVIIEVYRTTASGTVYYKCTSTAEPDYSDPTTDAVDIIDTLSDADLTSNEPLYDSGELANSAPPCSSIVTTWKGRAWLAGLEDPDLLWFSKRATQGFPINFSELQTLKMSPAHGPIRDLAVMGDTLVIFKERAIYYQTGDGPLNTGAQSDYGSGPQLITSDVGASVTGCVAEIPDGLMFVSHKGIYLLSRSGGGCEPIGMPVTELFDSLTFVAAVADHNQSHGRVYFVTEQGTWLVYDYLNKQWGTWVNLPAIDATIRNNVPIYINAGGFAFQQGETFRDNGTAIALTVGTSWLSPQGQQGYCQLHKLAVIGDYVSTHNLRVELYRNYSNVAQSWVVNVDGTLDLRAYGSGTYGTGTYGSETPRYQFDLRADRKLESFRVVLTDQAQSGTGESMSLSGLRFEIAGLPGINRLPSKVRQN